MVKEPRPYTKFSATPTSAEEIGMTTGIMAAKRELNTLHRELAEDGFNQVREREREREKGERERVSEGERDWGN